MAILTIKQLLELKGLDTSKKIKLVRQKKGDISKIRVNNVQVNKTLYDLYRNDKDLFLIYQGEQSKPLYDDVDYIVSFLGEESTLARFVGVYRIDSREDINYDYHKYLYQMSEVEGFDELKERVIVDWGKSTLMWHQWLDQNDKSIIEITAGFDYLFPGYDNVILNLNQLKNIILEKEYPIWKKMFSAVNAIYVIADNNSGALYIGSTYNKEGIWGRWKKYAQTEGHGGNVELKELLKADPDYMKNNCIWSILKILPINVTADEAIKIETLYKNKFGKVACQLNDN